MTTPADPAARAATDGVDVPQGGNGEGSEDTPEVALTTDEGSQFDDLPVKPDNA